MQKIIKKSALSFCLFVYFSLCGCGFSPLYGEGATRTQSVSLGLQRVEIRPIPDESGVFLRNALLDNFYTKGYPQAPLYRLDIRALKETQHNLDITKSSESTRKQLRLSTTIRLKDFEGKVLLTRDLVAITGYNVLGSQFTTRVSEKDAREAAINDLARQITTQTALYLSKVPPADEKLP